MKLTPEITIAELMERFPNGFSVGPGTPENPGILSWIIFASSHFRAVAINHPILVVDMDE